MKKFISYGIILTTSLLGCRDNKSKDSVPPDDDIPAIPQPIEFALEPLEGNQDIPSSFQGLWQSECLDSNGSQFIVNDQLNDSSLERTLSFDLTASRCRQISYDLTYRYEIEELSLSQTHLFRWDTTLIVRQVYIDLKSELLADKFNHSQVCGIDDWQMGKRDLTDLHCNKFPTESSISIPITSSSSMVKTTIALQDEGLFWGAEAEDDFIPKSLIFKNELDPRRLVPIDVPYNPYEVRAKPDVGYADEPLEFQIPPELIDLAKDHKISFTFTHLDTGLDFYTLLRENDEGVIDSSISIKIYRYAPAGNYTLTQVSFRDKISNASQVSIHMHADKWHFGRSLDYPEEKAAALRDLIASLQPISDSYQQPALGLDRAPPSIDSIDKFVTNLNEDNQSIDIVIELRATDDISGVNNFSLATTKTITNETDDFPLKTYSWCRTKVEYLAKNRYRVMCSAPISDLDPKESLTNKILQGDEIKLTVRDFATFSTSYQLQGGRLPKLETVP